MKAEVAPCSLISSCNSGTLNLATVRMSSFFFAYSAQCRLFPFLPHVVMYKTKASVLRLRRLPQRQPYNDITLDAIERHNDPVT